MRRLPRSRRARCTRRTFRRGRSRWSCRSRPAAPSTVPCASSRRSSPSVGASASSSRTSPARAPRSAPSWWRKSAPDGYTLLLASQTNAISASLYTKLAYDPIEDFAPISLIGREPGVLVVNPALPVRSFKEFVAYVKERPGQIDYASSGNGSGQHLFMALLASMTGMKLVHVPYKGSGQATTDLIGGQVPVSIPGTAGMVGHIKAGKLRPLAVTGATRSPQLPDVPTVIESGVPGYEAYVWMGLLAPKGTPAPIVDKIYRDVRGDARDRRGQIVHGQRRHRNRRLDARRIRALLPDRTRSVGEGRARNGRQGGLNRRWPTKSRQRTWRRPRR